MDLLLDADHDLALGPTGNVLLTPSDAAACAQRLTILLLSWRGGWFLNQNYGIPYTQEVLADEAPNLPLLRVLFTRQIEADPFVVRVTSMNLDFTGSSRNLAINFEAQILSGENLTINLEQGLVDNQLVLNGIGIFLDGVPIVFTTLPANVLTLDGEALMLDGEYLVFDP